MASIRLTFANKALHVVYANESGKDYGFYTVSAAFCDGTELEVCEQSYIVIAKEELLAFSNDILEITVTLI